MSNVKEISVDEFKGAVGIDTFKKCTSYILDYFFVTDENFHSTVSELKIIKNRNGSFSVYETERGNLINSIRKGGKNKFIVLPIGLLKVFANKIMQSLSYTNGYTGVTIYERLFAAVDLPDNEKLDDYLFYLGVVVSDYYSVDINKSIPHHYKTNKLTIDAIKGEFVIKGSGIRDFDYEEVSYIFDFWSSRDKVKISKIYNSNIPSDEFFVSIEEIIKDFMNEV